jgi:hypothetical protein
MHGFTCLFLIQLSAKPLGLWHTSDATSIHPRLLHLANAETGEACATTPEKALFFLQKVSRAFLVRREVAWPRSIVSRFFIPAE